MVISLSEFRKKTFCGIRLPWALITRKNRILLRLTITEFKFYSLQLYYTSFRTNWSFKISQVYEFYHKIASAVYVMKPRIFILINVKSYHYHVMSQHENNIKISITLANSSMAHLTIHDGPGSLSPTIFEAANALTTDMIQTSAFAVFINILLSDFHINASFSLAMTASYNRRHVLSCVNYQHGLIRARSSKLTNTVCLATIKQQSEIGVHVQTFQFYGPTVATALSPSVCQYGGLSFKFGSKHTYYDLCGSTNGYSISSVNRSISFVVVWFSGYSQGLVIAHLSLLDCKIMYSELVMSQKTLLKPNNLVHPHILTGCMTFLCPALQNRYQEACIMELGPPALGSVQISLIARSGLSSCEPSYLNSKNTERNISIKTVSMDNWPLTSLSNVSHSFHKLGDYVVKRFDYLHSATIYLPYMCNKRATRKQFGVNVKISSCVIIEEGIDDKKVIVNNIPALMDRCVRLIYYFSPRHNVEANHTEFLHVDTGDVENLLIITVDYVQCPEECKNYKYKTFVRVDSGKTVLEYTTAVGNPTFTGDYHRGFRVSILTPDPLCNQHLQCKMLLFVSEEKNSYAKKKVEQLLDDIPTLYFHHNK